MEENHTDPGMDRRFIPVVRPGLALDSTHITFGVVFSIFFMQRWGSLAPDIAPGRFAPDPGFRFASIVDKFCQSPETPHRLEIIFNLNTEGYDFPIVAQNLLLGYDSAGVWVAWSLSTQPFEPRNVQAEYVGLTSVMPRKFSSARTASLEFLSCILRKSKPEINLFS